MRRPWCVLFVHNVTPSGVTSTGRPWDSTALPDNFCIIESRESVRVRLPLWVMLVH